MELLDIVDENGIPTGEVVERKIAHSEGILHRTAHVWLLRRKENGVQILLQKRSDNKDSFPDCFDISSAGHIPAGVDFKPSAIRELKEELGYVAEIEELIYVGTRRIKFKEIFHNELFIDNQVSRVYVLWCDLNEREFILQQEEVSEVKWFDFDECYKGVKENTIHHCIYVEELDLIRKLLGKDEVYDTNIETKKENKIKT